MPGVLARQLGRAGITLSLVVEEQDSRELRANLTAEGWTLPFRQDVDCQSTPARSNFGTPRAHVLDGADEERELGLTTQDGRVRALASVAL